MNQPPPAPGQRPKNWFERNLAWVIPLGCLGSLACMATFLVLILTFIFGMMRSSGAYKTALAEAQTDTAVQTALGAPIEGGFFVSGNINVNGPNGNASLAIPISGPTGEGTIYAEASKSAGQWTYSTLVVEIKESGERIDLLE